MKKKPLVIGHRGAMGYETENTLASVQKALDLGVDMIEIDVFNVKSGETVVFHDQHLDRLSNAGGNIEDYYISEVRQVILDGNHRIPLLQQVLKLIDNKVALNIELKGNDTANRVNHITSSYIKNRGWSIDNFVISSFNWDELRKMRELNPDIAIAVLTEEDPLEAIAVAKELNAVAINPWYKTLNLENVQKIQDEGFKVFTYTVNEPADIEQVTAYGVDGIFTDYPDRAQ
ncbi:MAG: glycerophosphodiester phosphodiesterase family protein [Bacteroidota bacterium]